MDKRLANALLTMQLYAMPLPPSASNILSRHTASIGNIWTKTFVTKVSSDIRT